MATLYDGAWGRRPNGELIYTHAYARVLGSTAYNNLTPDKVQLPSDTIYSMSEGKNYSGQLRESSHSCRTGNVITFSGATSVKIQVGWYLTGRKRYHFASAAYVDYDSNKNLWSDNGEIMSHNSDGSPNWGWTLLSAGKIANIQETAPNGRNFFLCTTEGTGASIKEIKLDSRTWNALSDGLGGVTWEKV